MEAIKGQIRELYAAGTEDERRQIQTDLRDLQTSLDSEWDMVVRPLTGLVQLPLIKILIDLNLFAQLSSSPTPLTLSSLATTTGASQSLLGHILRASAAFGVIKETAQDEFSATRITHSLANASIAGAAEYAYALHAVVMHALPEYLKSHGYKEITSNLDLPFQLALKTDLAPFEWMKQHPEHMKSLGHAMAIQRTEQWTDHYPITSEIGSFVPASDSALLVDVGGGFGHQTLAFRSKFPDAKGRTVVQDIPETLDRAPKVEEVEFQVHDFFAEQPIKGAKFYYLRHILHDWTDSDCVKILSQIVPAMGPESRIVIDEVVLPNSNIPWQAAVMDMIMMSCLGGIERTRGEYEKLLDEAGLKILDVKVYDPKMQGVILAGLK